MKRTLEENGRENVGRTAAGKSGVFGLLERETRVSTKVVESVSADELMRHLQAKTRKGSVYYTDAFRRVPILETLWETSYDQSFKDIR